MQLYHLAYRVSCFSFKCAITATNDQRHSQKNQLYDYSIFHRFHLDVTETYLSNNTSLA